MPSLPRLRTVTLALVVACLSPAVGAGEEQPARERIEIRVAGGRSDVEGRILVEAADGGLLVERADERYELLQPDVIVGRSRLAAAAPVESPRELGRRIVAELPPGFELHVTRHYVVCYDTSRDYAKWCAALFERLHDAFGNFWSKAGLEIVDPPRPLVVVIFADRRAYEAHAGRDLGPAADRVVGYYNLMSNRVTTFDLTGRDGVPGPDGRERPATGLEILSSPAASGLVSTLVHEATHQMAFNCGMHRRLAPIPLWVSEGVAAYFESPDLQSARGWRGIGVVNRPRLDHFLAAHRPGTLEAIVVGDDRFRAADGPLDAYAAAWALTWHLLQTRKESFVAYMRTLAAKEPLAADSPEERVRDFRAAFGVSPGDLEEPVAKAMARLATQRR